MKEEFEKMEEHNVLYESRKILKINNCNVNILKQEEFGERWRKVQYVVNCEY